MTFSFDEATHTYRIDGQTVPSVSAVLKAGGLTVDYKTVNPAVLQYAADRGSYVESCCALDDLGELNEEAMEPTVLGYLKAWRAYRQTQNGLGIFSDGFRHQVRLYHPEYLYAGAADLITRNAVIDIKCTSKIAPYYRVQLAGYNLAGLVTDDGVPHAERARRIVVQLLPSGRYVAEEYENGDDERAFLAALELYRWKTAVAA